MELTVEKAVEILRRNNRYAVNEADEAITFLAIRTPSPSAAPAINTISKQNLKDKFYLVKQVDCWLLWHGTVEDLKSSILGNLESIEYSRTSPSACKASPSGSKSESAEKLIAATIERDGGDHDDCCKYYRVPSQGCNCGHDAFIEALAAYQKESE